MFGKITKSALSLILVFLVCISLVACGGKATSGTETTNSTQDSTVTNTQATSAEVIKEPVEIEFATFNSWAGDKATVNFQGVFEAFEKATGNKVKMTLYPDDQFINMIKTKLATGDVPDLFAANAGEDFVPYINLEPLEGSWIEGMKNDNLKNRVTRKTDGKVVEAYYSLQSYLCMLYNKDIFAEVGLTPPFMTFSELKDACEKLKTAGYVPIYMANGSTWAAEMLPGLGGVYMFAKDKTPVEKMMKNEVKPSQVPQIIDLAARYNELRDKGYFNEDYMTASFEANNGNDRMATDNKIAMWPMGTWLYADWKTRFPDVADKIGAMPFTLGDDYISGITSFNLNAFAVPSASENKDTAKEFINFVFTPENWSILHVKEGGGSPIEGLPSGGIENPQITEYEAFLKDKNIPLTDSYYSQYSQGFNWGATYEPWQAITAGKAPEKAFDDWYTKYAQLNKAQKVAGF